MPLAQAIAEEGAASSSSLEEEIDKFRFEEEAIVISKAEEEADEYSCVQIARKKRWPPRLVQV